jgi:RNase P/RNase MRP subunit p30
LNCDDFNEIQSKLLICEKLGIKNLIIEPTNVLYLNNAVKFKIKKLTSINLNYRINIKPTNFKDYQVALNSVGKSLDIISIETDIKDVQIKAAKDSRIDLISFSKIETMKTLTSGVISLVKQNNSFIEISLVNIMEENKSLQSKSFREIFRTIDLMRSLKVNLIINGNFADPYEFRHPRSLVSICHTLFGMPLVEAKRAFKDNVKSLLERARNRNSFNYVEDGIRILKSDN